MTAWLKEERKEAREGRESGRKGMWKEGNVEGTECWRKEGKITNQTIEPHVNSINFTRSRTFKALYT